MILAVMVAISWLDIQCHRIPNRLLFALATLIAPAAHFHPAIIAFGLLFFFVTGCGAGDLKYSIIASSLPSTFVWDRTLLVALCCIFISLLLWRKNGNIPLAPTISAAILINY